MAGKRRRVRKNPPLVVVSNPRGVVGRTTRALHFYYRHKTDGKLYHHATGAGVTIEALPDGSLRLRGPRGRRLWGDY